MPNLKLKSWTVSTLSNIIVPRYNSVYRMPYHINVDWVCLVKLFKIDKVHMFHKSNWRCNIFLVTIEHIYIFLKQKNFIDPIWIVWLQMKSSGKFLVFLDLSIIFLLISTLTNGLRLHQFVGIKTTEANKSLKTDANRAN